MAVLRDPTCLDRRKVVQALTLVSDARVVKAFILALKDEDSLVRVEAVEALGDIRESQATDALITALADPDSHVRVVTVTALGNGGDVNGVPHLVQALCDPNWDVRKAAVEESAYFLDFETVMQAVPIWADTRPYQTILYQFSCHVVKSDGTLTHAEFLDTSGGDPRAAFAESLIAALGEKSGGNNGPIFMYSPYERTQLRSLADAVPKHRAAIERIISRLVDLLPITRDNYYHPAQQGSWSIKSVLPALFGNDDAALSYEKLDEAGAVANGGAAQAAYLEAIDPATIPERKADLHAQLLAYCKLDTYAMVRLWQVFAGRTELKL